MSITSHVVGVHQWNDYDVDLGERVAARVNNSNCVATVINDIRHHGNAERCNDSNISLGVDLNQPGIHPSHFALCRPLAHART